jgi:hypothetical protein
MVPPRVGQSGTADAREIYVVELGVAVGKAAASKSIQAALMRAGEGR